MKPTAIYSKIVPSFLPGLAGCLMLIIASCGFATSDEQRLQQADENMASGDYRSATIELKNVLANDPKNIDARLKLAEVSFGLGDLDAAEKEMTRAAELGAAESAIRPMSLRILIARNNFPEVLAALGMENGGLTEAQRLNFRGQALLGIGNTEAAIATYNDWLALEPKSVDAAVGLANSVAAAGDLNSAVSQLQDLTAQNPMHVDAWLSLASLYYRSADYVEAEAAIQNALANSVMQANIRRHIGILAGLAESQLALGKLEESRSSIARLSSAAPQSTIALILEARLAAMEQDYALAARHLQNLLNVSPDNMQAKLFLANIQIMRNNFAQAELLLNQVVALAPDNLQARKLLAHVQLRQAQPQGAIEALAPFLEDEQEDTDFYTLLAEASLQQGDAQSAIVSLRKAIELDPDNVEAKLNLAGAYLNAGKTASALDVIETVAEGGSADFRRERILMTVYMADNRGEDALAVAEGLLADHGQDSVAVMIAAEYFLRSGDADQAKNILSEFHSRNPEDIGVNLLLGRIELAAGNTAEASRLFKVVQSTEPNNLVALLGLAQIEAIAGRTDSAIAILENAAKDHPAELAPRVLLARQYLRDKRLAEAEQMANELTAIGYRNAAVSDVVGSVFLEAGRFDEAVAQFEIASSLNPESATMQFKLAQGYLALDRSVEATGALEKALQIKPDWLPAKATLTLVALRQGRSDEAMRLVGELRADNPTSAAMMVLEGEVLFYQQDFVGSASAYQRAVIAGAGSRAVLREFQARTNGELGKPETPLVNWLLKNPNDDVVRLTLAQFYQQSNTSAEATREYELIVQKQPDNVVALNNLAWQYQQLGDLDRAAELAERAYALAGESGSVADTLGWIYRDAGKLDKSIKLLREATRLSPDNGEIRYHLAAVLVENGGEAEARRLLEKLIDTDNQFPSRQQATELLQQL